VGRPRPGSLQALARRVRDNEAIWGLLRRIERRMIGAPGLAQVVEAVAAGIPAAFPAVARAFIAWHDPDHHARRLCQAGGGPAAAFVPLDRPPADASPCLGDCPPAPLAACFGPGAPPRDRVALVPLVLRDRPRGWLAQVSRRPGHFHRGQDTALLEHFAAVAALCVDAALDRERLRADGLTDPLTGVPNRRFFEQRLAEEVGRLRRGTPAALALVDVDHFKQVNDRHGHPTGDAVLRRVAADLGGGLRDSDLLARWGGEEFAVLLPATGPGQAREIGERLRRRVAASGETPAVTVSIGLAPGVAGEGAAAWLERADRALYAAKAAGRDRVMTGDEPDLSPGDAAGGSPPPGSG